MMKVIHLDSNVNVTTTSIRKECDFIMSKHAFLIIAYHQWELLKTLIRMMDDPRNDIYIHIDKKIEDIPKEDIRRSAVYSKVYFVKRYYIYRSTYSISNVELALIKSAMSKADYAYFHLISGQDLPIKNQDYIHELFEKNNGVNYIDIAPTSQMKRQWYERASLYNLFASISFDKKTFSAISARMANRALHSIQRTLRINRFRKFEKQGFTMGYGSSWFSITKDFAQYLLDNEELIKVMYGKYTSIAEESFVHTMFLASPFKDTIYKGEIQEPTCRRNLRYIIWDGNISPQTITMDMLDELADSPAIFARKFDINIDPKVIKEVENMFS